jgi:hypothetical protein
VRIALFALVCAGCAEYSVELESTLVSPLPVSIGDAVQIPEGLAVAVAVTPLRDGDSWADPAEVVLESEAPDVLAVSPIHGTDDQWLLEAAAVGSTRILATIRDHDAEPIHAVVTPQ